MRDLIYYGVSKNQYQACRKYVLRDNRNSLTIVGRVCSVLGFLLFILALCIGANPAATAAYPLIGVFFGVSSVIASRLSVSDKVQVQVIINMIAVYAFCIYLAVAASPPTENGVMALLVFTSCGMLAIVRLDLYLVMLGLACTIFTILEWRFKIPYVAVADTINGMVFSIIGIVLNYRVSSIRLKSYGDRIKLEEEVLRLNGLVENVPGGFGVFDCVNDELRPVVMNEQMVKLHHLKRAKVIRNTLEGVERCIHPDDRFLFREAVETAVREAGRFDVIYRLRQEQEQEQEPCYINAQGQVLVKEDGKKTAYINCTDISEQMQLQANRHENEAKSDFLSRMSHDLRTPMNVIIGMSALAIEHKEDSARVSDCLSKIHTSSHYLLGLVNDVLDMSKLDSSKMQLSEEPYPYEEFIGDIVTMVEPLCEKKHIRFIFSNEPTGCTILTDKVRLQQIYFNLLSNAVKFTPEYGQVELRIVNRKKTPDYFSSDNYVIDNGRGMSETFQRHMFEPFAQENEERTKDSRGTGLGLAIVYNLVKLMNGDIAVESRLGEGTSVKVRISFKLAKEEIKQPEPAEPVDFNGRRLLLVEDNPLNMEITMEILKKMGIEVTCAEDGKEAVEAFRASEEFYYDAVLMDIMMPNMDGYEATRAIRALARADSARVPVIALSANAFAEDVKKGKHAGMNDYLTKPLDPRVLVRTLQQHLSGERT